MIPWGDFFVVFFWRRRSTRVGAQHVETHISSLDHAGSQLGDSFRTLRSQFFAIGTAREFSTDLAVEANEKRSSLPDSRTSKARGDTHDALDHTHTLTASARFFPDTQISVFRHRHCKRVVADLAVEANEKRSSLPDSRTNVTHPRVSEIICRTVVAGFFSISAVDGIGPQHTTRLFPENHHDYCQTSRKLSRVPVAALTRCVSEISRTGL